MFCIQKNKMNQLYDENMFEQIDSYEKAYLLGWIISNGIIDSQKIEVICDTIDICHLVKLKNIILKHIPVICADESVSFFNINSSKICSNILNYIDDFDLKNDYIWIFIRGYFDASGIINEYEKKCEIVCDFTKILYFIKDSAKIPCIMENNKLIYENTNMIDFLGNVYFNDYKFKLERKYKQYINLLSPNQINLPTCNVYKSENNAIIPSKSKISDVGYDLSIIKKIKNFTSNTSLYDTGIKINLEYGYYAEIVPRSSLSKSGYILANSIGIIDNSYTNNIFIALTKIDPEAPDITFPFKCCQIIFRKQIHMDIVETKNVFAKTARNEGGFGSTDT